MKKVFIGLFSICIVANAMAQTDVDALRYTNLNPIGTARYSALGGAMGALGGDITTMAFNPAGIGVFRSNNFVVTPGFSYSQSESNYQGHMQSNSKSNMHLSNLGFVSTTALANNSVFKYVNFGFAYNQLANFNRLTKIGGNNNQSSKLDLSLNEILGEIQFYGSNNSDLWYDNLSYKAQLFMDANLLYPDDANDSYVSDYSASGYGEYQIKNIKSSGYAGQYDFNLSTNILDRIYAGMSVGILHATYKESCDYSEEPNPNISSSLYYFSDNEYLLTKGNGINFKLGLIGRINDWLRLGGAIHTPTYFYMHDIFDVDVYARYEYDGIKSATVSDNFFSDWSLHSPFKALGSAAFIIKKFGLISIDYEYLNYSRMRLESADYSYDIENRNIKYQYGSGHNVKVGGEYNLGAFSVRLGYSYFKSPYQTHMQMSDASQQVFSGGLGIKTKTMFVDFTAKYSMQQDYQYMYGNYNNFDAMYGIQDKQLTFLTSIGFKF